MKNIILEKEVCSLDLSKRLKELGFKQESLFYWFEHKENGRVMLAYKTQVGYYNENGAGFSDRTLETCDIYSAYTVAELGEMLPENFRSGKGDKDSQFYCRVDDEDFNPIHICFSDTEADARAEMLIYLKKNNLI